MTSGNQSRNVLLILGEFHAPVKVVRGQRGVSPFQIGDVRGAMDEAHMRHRVNEQIGRRERLLSDQIAPELAREIEFDIDGERLRDIDAAVAALGRVVEFAQAAWPVPALFQASELSSAAPSSVSKISMRSDGSSSLRNTAKVALMMPAPTSTMSVSAARV